MFGGLNATGMEIAFMAAIDRRNKDEMRRACAAYEKTMRGRPMDTEVEITTRGIGERAVVTSDCVMVYENGSDRAGPVSNVSLRQGRLIAKAIADYDRAVAAVGVLNEMRKGERDHAV